MLLQLVCIFCSKAQLLGYREYLHNTRSIIGEMPGGRKVSAVPCAITRNYFPGLQNTTEIRLFHYQRFTTNSIGAESLTLGRRILYPQLKTAFRLMENAMPTLADDSRKARASIAISGLLPWPDFIQKRIDLWDRLMADYRAEISRKDPIPIKVTLPDGKRFDAKAWRTTPVHIAEKISKNAMKNIVIAKVNGEVWDLDRPFENDATLQLLKFDDNEAKQVFWHSSAHVLGEAMERYCGGHLCQGFPISEGFYCDIWHDHVTISQEDFSRIDQFIGCIIKDSQPFERLEMTKDDLLEMFRYNEFKVRIIMEKIKNLKTTVYRCGPFIDICHGPHVRHTGVIRAMHITKASSSYWEGKAEAETLQRIYGISFPNPKQLIEWHKFQEEASKRDHRRVGRDQGLFFFDPLSPGSAFWYPKGAHIYNTLIKFIRKEYRKRGFTEVITPNIFNYKLWEISGHWQHYSEDMFKFEVERELFGLKPMNCPGHCLMYSHQPRTHNDLPIRYADFGVLHRNEMSGALSGLTRLRRFQQDDAHIFCRQDQIMSEIRACLDFLSFCFEEVYGLTFKLNLATRPKSYIGDVSTWDKAENDLKKALNESGRPWYSKEGDGAFYGPKIDITIQDALKRNHQCGTIQLDFQLPQKFNLSYINEKGEKQRPVIIHRAVLGSVERMAAILAENYGGKWPFWLSPRQAKVIAIHESVKTYAKQVKEKLYNAGFEVEFDDGCSDTLNKQIRNAQLAQFNFILITGQNEVQNNTVNVRTRHNKVCGEIRVEELIRKFSQYAEEYTKDA